MQADLGLIVQGNKYHLLNVPFTLNSHFNDSHKSDAINTSINQSPEPLIQINRSQEIRCFKINAVNMRFFSDFRNQSFQFFIFLQVPHLHFVGMRLALTNHNKDNIFR